MTAAKEVDLKENDHMLYLSHDAGHAVVEYASILRLMVAVVIAVMVLLGPAISNFFSRLQSM